MKNKHLVKLCGPFGFDTIWNTCKKADMVYLR